MITVHVVKGSIPFRISCYCKNWTCWVCSPLFRRTAGSINPEDDRWRSRKLTPTLHCQSQKSRLIFFYRWLEMRIADMDRNAPVLPALNFIKKQTGLWRSWQISMPFCMVTLLAVGAIQDSFVQCMTCCFGSCSDRRKLPIFGTLLPQPA